MLILDSTCAGRHIWNDKDREDVVYADRRVCPRGSIPVRPNWSVSPDVVCDFVSLPFPDDTFDMVVFDPPHIIRDTPSSGGYLRMKYGELRPGSWRGVVSDGFRECWRVLRSPGTLHFKWSEGSATLREVLSLFPERPLFRNGNGGRVSWSVFAKSDRR